MTTKTGKKLREWLFLPDEILFNKMVLKKIINKRLLKKVYSSRNQQD